jgi:hypothetical protein
MPQWRQDYPDNRPPTRATAISEMGQNRPPALQKISKEFRPEARRALFSGTCGRGRLLPVQRLGGMTDATAGVFIAGLAAWPLSAQAQRFDRMRRIGVLMSGDENDPEEKAQLSGFTQALAKLGWTDGRNLRIRSLGRRQC